MDFDSMMVAVRVLTALNEKRPPDPADLGYLCNVRLSRQIFRRMS